MDRGHRPRYTRPRCGTHQRLKPLLKLLLVSDLTRDQSPRNEIWPFVNQPTAGDASCITVARGSSHGFGVVRVARNLGVLSESATLLPHKDLVFEGAVREQSEKLSGRIWKMILTRCSGGGVRGVIAADSKATFCTTDTGEG